MPQLGRALALTLLLGIAHAAEGDSPPARRIAERTVAATVGIRRERDRFIDHRGAGFVISPAGRVEALEASVASVVVGASAGPGIRTARTRRLTRSL